MRALLLLVTISIMAACATPPPPEPPAAEEPKAPVEASSSVDRAVATTGDVITYTVTLDYDPAYEVEVPETGAEIAGFRIIDIGREKPETVRPPGGSERVVEKRWYKLRADLVGSYVLPPIRVAYRPKGEGEETESAGEAEGEDSEAQVTEIVSTSEIFVEVESVLPEEGAEEVDILDIKPLRVIEEPPPWAWIAAGAAAGLLLLAGGGILLWRRIKNRPAPPPLPAHEVAFAALDRLRGTDFEDPEAVRRFHFAISEVLRAYVEARFGLNATDLTTEEILPQLPRVRGLDARQQGELERFLLDSDRVKFAAHVPSEAEIQGTYERALAFVEATRERPEVGLPETAGGSGEPGVRPPEEAAA